MPQKTIWDLAPHTAAKHHILRAYLGGWFPVLASANGRVAFIDGFAGPGEYLGGEPGSPIIALESAIQHRSDLSACELNFLFIEEDRRRAEHLKELLETRENAGEIPKHVVWNVTHAAFEDAIASVLKELGAAKLAPSFVMLDPFGVKGITFETIRRLSGYPKIEFLISFMYESISRFIATPEFAPHLDLLYGRNDWRDAIGLPPAEKQRYLHDLYKEQLETLGLHVRSFELLDDGNRTEYYLFFGTRHHKGVGLMKDAMWKVAPTGGYRFSDATNQNQMTLFGAEPDYDQLRREVLHNFSPGDTTIEAVEEFVLLKTAFRVAHLRKYVLVPLETEAKLSPLTPRHRVRTYPAGTGLRFA